MWILLKKNGLISNNEAKIWRDQIKRNESMCQDDSKEIKSKILKSLDKLNEIRNNRNYNIISDMVWFSQICGRFIILKNK